MKEQIWHLPLDLDAEGLLVVFVGPVLGVAEAVEDGKDGAIA